MDALRIAIMCLGVLTLLFANVARAGEEPVEIRLPYSVEAAALSEVTVQPGDHLWKISDRGLTAVLGREANDAEISPYWHLVIEENREGLRSGDPDLIYPGEVLTLPPSG